MNKNIIEDTLDPKSGEGPILQKYKKPTKMVEEESKKDAELRDKKRIKT